MIHHLQNLLVMKRYSLFALLMVLFTVSSVKAQYDDIYYDPARDARSTTRTKQSQTRQYEDNNGNSTEYDSEYLADDYFEYDDDYDDYYYASRIRRFARPMRGFGYYDYAFVDYFYYDPFYNNRFWNRPTLMFSFGNDYWSRYNSWNRWNNWGWYDRYWNDACAFNSLRFGGYYSPYAYNSWGNNFYDPWGYNSWGNNYYANNYGGGGYYNRYRNPYYTGLNNNYNNNYNDNGRTRTYAPRRSSTTGEPITPSGARSGGREKVITRESTPSNNNTEPNGRIRPKESNTRNERQNAASENRQRFDTVTDDGTVTPSPTEGVNRKKNLERQNNSIERTQPRMQTDDRRELEERQLEQQRNYERQQKLERQNRATEERRNNENNTRPSRPERNNEQPRQERNERRYEQPRQETPRRESAPSYNPPARQESRQSSPPPSNNNSNRSSGRSGSRD
jgi:hypothetical protein